MKVKFLVFSQIFVSAVLAMIVVGCGGHAPAVEEPAAPAMKKSVLPNDGTRQVGDTTTCPVSGKTFTVSADSPKAEHEGKTYFMCCGGCKNKFEADPAKYLDSKGAEPASTPTTDADVLPNDGSRKVGDVTKCPTSGEVFTISADSPKTEHEGKTYFFCCGGCVDKFNADPSKYL